MVDMHTTPKRLFAIAIGVSLVYLCIIALSVFLFPELPASQNVNMKIISGTSMPHSKYKVQVYVDTSLQLTNRRYKLKSLQEGRSMFFDLDVKSYEPLGAYYEAELTQENSHMAWVPGSTEQVTIFTRQSSKRSFFQLLLH